MGKRFLTQDVLLSKEILWMLEQEGYQAGQRLPSERELALRFGVQRMTLRGALQQLLQKGTLVAKERQGYFVAPKKMLVDLNEFKSTQRLLKEMGKTSYVKLLEFDRIKASTQLSGKTMLPEGTDFYRIMRLRYENQSPVSLDRSYVPCELTEGLSQEDVHNKSLYTTLKNKFHISVSHSNQKVTIVYANGLEAELLNVSLSKPLMKYQGLVYDKHHRLIEFFENIMLTERIEFISNNY